MDIGCFRFDSAKEETIHQLDNRRFIGIIEKILGFFKFLGKRIKNNNARHVRGFGFQGSEIGNKLFNVGRKTGIHRQDFGVAADANARSYP